MEPFLISALVGGLGMAAMCGPLGCFIAWLRLAYFGDAIGHAALLGVALSLFLSLDLTLGIVFASLAMALLLVRLQRDTRLSADMLLGVLAHGALAFGLVAISLMHYPFDLQAYLFGDILTLTGDDLVLIYSATTTVLFLLAANWKSLMLMVASREIALAEGVKVERLRTMLMVLIALAVAASVKVVGLLLVTSMLIIPAASARAISRTPGSMACFSVLIGVLAVTGGLAASYYYDTPSGPSVILAAIILFMFTRIFPVILSGVLHKQGGVEGSTSTARK